MPTKIQKNMLEKNKYIEKVNCPICKKEFFKSNKPRSRTPTGVKGYNCITCSRNCSRILAQTKHERRMQKKRKND